MIEGVDSDPSWPRQCEAVRADLARALQSVPVISIEHVGSASVPGLAAEPILDIDVVAGANQVRAAGGLTEQELDEIEQLNRAP